MNNENAAVKTASAIPARVALAAAALLTLATPYIASAAPVTYGGIELRAARVDPDQNDLQNSELPFETAPHVLLVSYVNRTTVAATDVSFEVTGLGDQVIHDVGTFSPNTVINRRFWNVGNGGDTVQIVAVKYADGTTWTAGSSVPLRQATEE